MAAQAPGCAALAGQVPKQFLDLAGNNGFNFKPPATFGSIMDALDIVTGGGTVSNGAGSGTAVAVGQQAPARDPDVA